MEMKNSIAFILSCILIVSCNSKREDLVITGKIDGLKKGKLFLQKIQDTTIINLDSVILYNTNEFNFSVELEHPEVLYLQLQKDTLTEVDNFIPFFADKGNLQIQTSLDQFSLPKISTDYENQKVFNTYSINLKRFADSKLDLIKAELEARKSNNTKRLDSVNEAYDRMNKRRVLYAINYAKAHPGLEVSPYIVLNQAQYINKRYLDTVYNAMDKTIQKSFYGKQLKELVDADD